MAKIDTEKSFRVAYTESLRRHGAFVEYMPTRERQGVPDLHWCRSGAMGWQELKFVDQLPSRSSSNLLSHHLTGQQRLFLVEVCQQGQLGIVAIGHPMTLVSAHYGAGVIGVSFFWPDAFDAHGQITVAQLRACERRHLMKDGGACLRELAIMHKELRSQPRKMQGALW